MIKNPISYPGNKNKLLKEIIPLFPKEINVFVDVFCGSGVVGVNSNAKNINCNDISKHCLDVLKYFYFFSFAKIISDLEKIIVNYNLTYSRTKEKGFYKEIKHEGLSLYNKDGYNQLKEDYNEEPSVDKLVVLLIYGFNHYMRFNSKGEFNVPVGKVDLSKSIYKDLEIFVNYIKSKDIIFTNSDFRNKNLYINQDALYYFDPPYLVTTAPYNSHWNETDEIELLKVLDELNDRGVKFALSNVLLSNGKENVILKEWSRKYNVIKLKRQYRNANYQKINITDTVEVLIVNYHVEE